MPGSVLGDPRAAYVSRYALGRDYHKVLRARLQSLADRIAADVGPFGYRVFTDSAPVLEVALAANAGVGWRGKHTLLLDARGRARISSSARSTPTCRCRRRPASADHCGTCSACIDRLSDTGDRRALRTRRTALHLVPDDRAGGPIPEALRPLIGNRVYGCDDCQLACPWNRFAQAASENDFNAVRNGLDAADLVELFAWSEAEFDARMEGSAIRRIGYERWLRNLAVGLGNAPRDPRSSRRCERAPAIPSPLVREHVAWALGRQMSDAR